MLDIILFISTLHILSIYSFKVELHNFDFHIDFERFEIFARN